MSNHNRCFLNPAICSHQDYGGSWARVAMEGGQAEPFPEQGLVSMGQQHWGSYNGSVSH